MKHLMANGVFPLGDIKKKALGPSLKGSRMRLLSWRVRGHPLLSHFGHFPNVFL
jgi:hypothetical protein